MTISLRSYAEAYVQALPKSRNPIAECDEVAARIMDIPALRAFLTDPSVPEATRAHALEQACQTISKETIRFFLLLAVSDRIRDLDAIMQHVRSANAAVEGKRHALVTSTVPLQAAERERVRTILSKKFKQDVILEERVDRHLLSGLLVTVEGWTFDATLKGRLDRLTQTLTV